MIVLLQEYIANTNYQGVIVNSLDEPIIARYIRIHPVAWHGYTSMRIELYGCYSGEDRLTCLPRLPYILSFVVTLHL